MMFRLRYLLVLLLAISAGCADFSTYRYRNFYTMLHPVESTDRTYSDTALSFRFEISEKRIDMYIENIGEKKVRLKWPHVKFFDTEGVEHRIANRQTLFSKEPQRIKATEIQPGEKEENLIVPLDNVEKIEQWTWIIKPFFNQEDDRALLNKGKTFSIVFPVRVGTENRNYRFDFVVSNVIAYMGRNPR